MSDLGPKAARDPSGPAGVLLAAGASSRMGEPKALLRHADGRTFLRASIESLRDAGLSRVFVVLGGHRELIEAELERIQAALHRPPSGPAAARAGEQTAVCLTSVINPAPERGQVSSMAVGLRAALDAGCALAAIALVDQPVQPVAVVAQLLASARAEPEALHVPLHRGQRGHPAFFPARLAALLERAKPDQSARFLLAEAGVVTREHAVESSEVLVDVDTPAELAAWRSADRLRREREIARAVHAAGGPSRGGAR